MQQVRDWLRAAEAVAVLTGAGISVESGVPTFRGSGGLWEHFRAEDLATSAAFARDPRLVWRWYDWRRSVIAKAEPNAGHRALAALETEKARFTLITQNVDGLHDRAGSRRLLKIHGDIWNLRCTRCERRWTDMRPSLPELPPHCECGALARPDVVWFGEPLPADVWMKAEEAAASADLLLVVGTSALVYPAAGLVLTAQEGGARVVEINPERTPFSGGVDRSLQARAGEALPQLLRRDSFA